MGGLSHPSFAELPDTYRPHPLPVTLFKNFPKRDYAEAFLSGELRMKTLSYYRSLEAKGDIRGDGADGTLVEPMDGKTIEVQDPKTGVWHPIHMTTGQMKVSANSESILISCYSMVPTALQYGAFQVKIFNVAEFMARIGSSGDDRRLGWGAVDYSDKFGSPDDIRADPSRVWRCKRTRFADDQEFRIMVGHHTKGSHKGFETKQGGPIAYRKFVEDYSLNLEIGDISDITTLTVS